MEMKEPDLTPDQLNLVQDLLKKRINERQFRVSIQNLFQNPTPQKRDFFSLKI